jgi:catechol 2,3-dioxygenase-like lactoylglutathione lyase family enzyme
MNPNKLFPMVITEKLAETKAFYVEQAGFEIVHDMDGYLQVRYGADESGPELAFMRPDAAPPLGKLPAFSGQGLVISVPTQDADATFTAYQGKKVPIVAEPSDKPWGWRSFLASDPNGVVLDFFHVIDQAAVADATG